MANWPANKDFGRRRQLVWIAEHPRDGHPRNDFGIHDRRCNLGGRAKVPKDEHPGEIFGGRQKFVR